MKRKMVSGFVLFTITLFLFSIISVPKPAFAVDYENQYHHIHIESEGAWAITQGLKNITVAIIDSGIDYSHPDLVNVAWINDDEIANNSIDDDGNGFIDDVYGWDFVSNDSVPGPEVDDPIHWHATFIAGIIAAPKDGEGVVGVAPNITVMDIRVLKADNYAGTSTEGLGDAIKYAVDNGADVINMSLQYYPNALDYYDDILYAISQNVPVISVTGNNFGSEGGQEYQSFPGGYEEVISVGATNHLKLKADYSNYGVWTEIVAPVGDADSINIRSCVPPMDYWYGWGTSFACPQVAATVALMRSLNYSMSIEDLRYILQNSSTDLGEIGRDIYFGYGLLNASRAVRAVLDPSELLKRPLPEPEPTTPITPPTTPEDTNYYLLAPVFILISIFLVIKWKKRKLSNFFFSTLFIVRFFKVLINPLIMRKLRNSTFLLLFVLIVTLNLTSNNRILNDSLAVNYENSFHHMQIFSKEAWQITKGLKEITVAVIDSGIDFSHPELTECAWINDDEIANNSIDDDGNGFIDDIHGWDFVSNDNTPGPEVDDPIHWHATFIAGIIAAPEDGEGIVGVAPNITIMDVRVLYQSGYQGTSNAGFGNSIKYAVDNGADVINLSLQYYANDSTIYDDIVYAIQNNVVVVSITGNTALPTGGLEFPSFPGAYEEVISVGATNYYQEKADYSNYGEWTEIVAPVGDEAAINIRSTAPPDTYWTGWGTSFACPQVASAAALMKSVNSSLTVAEIRDILQRSATDLGEPGRDIYTGYGMLNVSKAVEAAIDISVLQPPEKNNFTLIVILPSIMLIALVIKRKRR